MNLSGFDASKYEVKQGNFEPLPAGKYHVMVAGAKEKATKRGDGAYLEIEFQVLDDRFPNRKLWTRLNLRNPNPEAVRIAEEQLAAICQAVGILQPHDSGELIDRQLEVYVTRKPNKETGEMQNEVKGFYPLGSDDGAESPPRRRAFNPTGPQGDDDIPF